MSNLAATRNLFEIWNSREFEDLIPCVTADVEWRPATMTAVEGGSYHGTDDLRSFFEEWDHAWRLWEVEPEETEELGDQVLVLGHVHAEARGSGMELDQPVAYLFEFDDGLLARGATFFDHDEAREAARQRSESARRRRGVMSRFEDPVIISCSISGAIANRDQCPAIPYTPEEYAAEARRAVDEGASQIHIHARTPDGVPSYEIEDFRAITEAILAEVPDVIVNYSTGAIGVPVEKRLAYLRELTPDVAALNMSSMNYAKYSRRRKDFVFKAVFENSFDLIIEFLEAMRELGIKPEHECFDAGHVANLDPLIDMELVTEPHQISLVMGVTGGIRPNSRNIAFMSEQIPGGPDAGANWQVIGISRDQWKLLATSLVLGGNVRAGLEDNLYLPDGEMARSNGDLIGKARQMAEDVGRRAATIAEARQMLGLSETTQALTKAPTAA